MPLKASDLPWWKWLLIAAIAAALSGFTFVALIATSDSPAAKTFPILFPMINENALLFVIIMLLVTLVAASCTIIGIIRLIKWACEDAGVPPKGEKAAETAWRSEDKTRSLEQRQVSLETGDQELREINENLHELQSRLEQLAETRETESHERKEKISSQSFELLAVC